MTHNTKKRALYLNILAFSFLAFAVLRILNGIRQGIISDYTGDFVFNWPTFWAWKLNPELIKQNVGVIRWLGGPESKLWNYGPVCHFAAFPLIFLNSFKTAFLIWLFVSLALLLFTFYRWYQLLIIDSGKHSFFALSLFALVWFSFFPVYEALIVRVFEIMELFFLTEFFYFLSRKKDGAAGIHLGLAVMTKLLPGALLPLLLLKKKYRAFWVATGVTLFLALMGQITLGWENSFTLKQVAPVGATLTWYESQSLSSFIHRSFSHLYPFSNDLHQQVYPVEYAPALASKITQWVVYPLVAFYGLLFLFLGRKADLYWGTALGFSLMFLVLQWNHPHYFVFLLIGYSLAVREYFISPKSLGTIEKIFLVSSYVLVGLLVPLSIYKKLWVHFLPFYYLYSLSVYGQVILLFWLTKKYISSRTVTQNVAPILKSHFASAVQT